MAANATTDDHAAVRDISAGTDAHVTNTRTEVDDTNTRDRNVARRPRNTAPLEDTVHISQVSFT
jgi:hypothetical protein